MSIIYFQKQRMLVQLNKYIQRISDMNMSDMIGQSIMEHPPQDSNFNNVSSC